MSELENAPQGSQCPSAATLQELTTGELASDEAADVRAHLDRCTSCQTAVAQLLLGSEVAPLVAPSTDWAGRTIEGRYTVLQRVGAGASAVVYQARDTRLERDVALKAMRVRHPVEARALRGRLLAESKAMAGLRHPNIVTVFDVFEHEEHTVVAMELVTGNTFRGWLDEEPRTPSQVIETLSQAGQGLAHAHRQGWVHRDFKPENILVGSDGRVLVADFGLATLRPAVAALETADAGQTSYPVDPALRTLAVVGTPAYMAPEQWSGEALDGRADLFAFGVTLYEALYGRRPFGGTTADDIQRGKLAGEFRLGPLAGTNARLPVLLKRLLQADPTRRIESMDSVLSDLRALRVPRHRWLIPAALGVTTLGVLALRPWPSEAGDECTSAATAVLWDEASREAAEAQWSDNGGWVRLDADLTSYTQRWTEAWADACAPEVEAGNGHSALRRACLREQHAWVASTVELLLEGKVLPQFAMAAIPATSVCEGPGVIPVRQVPTDPEEVQQRRQLRADLYALWTLAVDRECPRALAEAPAVVERATALDDPWILADLYLAIGECSIVLGRLAPAKTALVRAAELATNSGHVGVAAEAWLRMSTVAILNERDADAAQEYAAFATGAIDNLGEAPSAQLLRAKLAAAYSSIARTTGDFDEAEQFALQSIAFAEPYGSLRVASFREDLALAYSETGRPDEAVEILLEVEQAYRDHGDVDLLSLNTVQLNLGGTLFDLGRLEEAERYSRLAIKTGLVVEGGEGNASLAPRLNLIQILMTAERSTEAAKELLAVEAAFDTMPNVRESDRILAGQYGVQLAWRRSDWHACAELGRSTAELPGFERATTSGVNTSIVLASCLVRVGRAEGALDVSKSLLEALDASGAPPVFFVLAEQAAARALLNLERASEARALLEKAQSRLTPASDVLSLLPTVHVDLARALWASGDSAEARRLATQAHAELRAHPDDEASGLLRSWATQHDVDLPDSDEAETTP